MGKTLTISLAAMAYFITLPALADWQFTRWGMTEEQVIAASKAQAMPMRPEDAARRSGEREKARLTMPYVSGDLNMTAIFFFDAAGKLSRVMLTGAERAYAPLTSKYGTQASDSGGVVKWFASGDQIMYLRQFGEIDYSPRINPENQGL